ncbi:anaerobic dehydrogenase membrane anchor subunit [Halalkaliarchaeum desulfuricum]|uniref:Anaerobic dehydrogenase membrane anchor subunit n=1 Tax=Halalkaliarchaeum desulfuricum TaxID=2055893 RepID=A0A343TMP7_9EURY|nr:NrfD/PsrC family molybdoenzyme membrane anchor subunit [Halalkaliarchaeum desulfuricum]AUX10369.1 anaerobic dehydrogenase membrane anchor subunit [Halalkaliarchaeum desulfuricum]
MATDQETFAEQTVLNPLTSISKKYIAVLIALLAFGAIYAEALVHQLRYGLVVTDMASWGTQAGVTWGLYIGAFEWYAGSALGSIALAGYIRFRGIDDYEMLARLGELWAVIAAICASFLIVIDLGRPERVIYVMESWPTTVQHSPLAWDVTFVTMLIVVSTTMLAMSLRRDYGWMDVELPLRARIPQKLLTVGYSPTEGPKLTSMLKYMGAGMLLLVVTAGMVPGWLFGVVGPQPGYYGKIQGVVFITGGIPAGIGALTVIAYAMRRIYDLEDALPDSMFFNLGKALGLFTFVYLIALFNQFMPMVFPMAPLGGASIADAMLYGALSTYFWTSIALLVFPMLALTWVYVYRTITPEVTVVASMIIMFGVFIKKNLAVLEPLMFPVGLPYEHGVYFPTTVEWVISLGVLFVGILAFIVLIKIIPMCSGTGVCCRSSDESIEEVEA